MDRSNLMVYLALRKKDPVDEIFQAGSSKNQDCFFDMNTKEDDEFNDLHEKRHKSPSDKISTIIEDSEFNQPLQTERNKNQDDFPDKNVNGEFNNNFNYLYEKSYERSSSASNPFEDSGSEYVLGTEEESESSPVRFTRKLQNNAVHDHESSSLESITIPSSIIDETSSSDINACPDFSPHTPLLEKVRKSSFKKNPGKKRKSFPLEWNRTKAKINLNTGNKSVTRKGNVRKSKSIKEPCSSKCRLRCFEKISRSQREELFEYFWRLGDKTRQWHFIVSNTKTTDKKTQKIGSKIQRNCNRNYFFNIKSEDNFVTEIRVCSQMFMNTLDINKQVIQTAYRKINCHGILSPDKRGRHVRPLNYISEQNKQLIRNHIELIPLVDSHYCRERTSKKYMSEELNIRKLHQLFKQKLDEEKNEAQITERQYRDVFTNEYNIGFHMPKKDQCDVCTGFQNNVAPTGTLLLDHQKHLERKNKARQIKEDGKIKAENSNGKILAIVYDFQKQLNTPCGCESSAFYYYRQYLTYNFTIYDLATKDAFCYVWHEIIAKKGANEVASSINHFLSTKDMTNVDEVHFYSDNCPSQNKNRIIYTFYAQASKKFNVNITHVYLEKGHTQNEGDSVHSVIERAKKNKKIYVPSQWYSLIHCAKRRGNPYNVIELNQKDIFNFKEIMTNLFWEKNTKNEKVYYNQIRTIQISNDAPGILNYKYEFEDDFETVNILIKKKSRGKSQSVKKLLAVPKALYNCELTITDQKKKDLKSLCEKKLIPDMYHNFYLNLKSISSNTENTVSSSDED